MNALNFRNTPTEWRAVDLATTKGIAQRCTSGMDFVGCSKALIYEYVAKPLSSCQSKPEKFIHLMDAAARISKRLNRELASKLNTELDVLASQFDADQPSAVARPPTHMQQLIPASKPMTEQETRIALCEAAGWRWQLYGQAASTLGAWFSPCGQQQRDWKPWSKIEMIDQLPDVYRNHADFVKIRKKLLKDDIALQRSYAAALEDVCGGRVQAMLAPLEQPVLALLLVLGLATSD